MKDFAAADLTPRGGASGGGKPPGGRATVPAYRPFPVGALPRTLREFVVGVSRWSDADPAFAALPALIVAGAAIGLAACASPKRKYTEPPLLWTCTVADSGTGKSPGLRPSADIALAIDKKLKARYAAAREKYEADLEAWDAADAPDPAAKPARPQREYFYLIDTTIERLAENLGSSPRGVVRVVHEVFRQGGGVGPAELAEHLRRRTDPLPPYRGGLPSSGEVCSIGTRGNTSEGHPGRV